MCSENPVVIDSNGEIDTDISVSGRNFNMIYEGVPLVKLTNEDGVHNGMVFGSGINTDHNTFKYDKTCGPDGIYFCKLTDAHHWFDYASMPMVYMWDVTIPNDAKTVIYSTKLKADSVILSNKRKIEDYVSNKLINMISTGEPINAIAAFIRSLPTHLKNSNQMDDAYISLLVRDVEFYNHIPEDKRTYNICLYVALNDQNGYEKIKNDFISYELMMECIKTNLATYDKIPVAERSREMSEYVFERDIKFYERIPQQHITLEMTEKYLAECETGNVSFVPNCFMNTPSVFTTVLPLDGNRLKDVDFKNQTRDTCMLAVQFDGKSIQHVPFNVLDQDMCIAAVTAEKNASVAYSYIPEVFKTIELKEAMITHNPKTLYWIPRSEYTHNMILAMINDDELLKQYLRGQQDTHISELLTRNMITYYAIRKDIHKFVSASYINDAIAYEIVKDDPSTYSRFSSRSLEFTIECVKVGVHFDNIQSSKITQDILNDLVTARLSVINELPKRYVSDDLYVICMKVHGMKLSDVPTAYYTEKLVKIGMDLSSDNCQIDIVDVKDSYVKKDYFTTSMPDRVAFTGELDISDISM